MRVLAAGLVVGVAWSIPLLGQERDRTLERISLELQQPPPLFGRFDPAEDAAPSDGASHTAFGVFTLVPPVMRGEIIRVRVPIGQLVAQACRGAAAAKRRRQEAAARRDVEAALGSFKKRRLRPDNNPARQAFHRERGSGNRARRSASRFTGRRIAQRIMMMPGERSAQ